MIIAAGRCGRVQTIGRLPEDFRQKMVIAAKNKPEWRKADADRDFFFKWFN